MPVLDSNFLIRLDEDDPVAIRALRQIDSAPLIVPYQAALEYACGTNDPTNAIEDVASAFTLERPETKTLQDATHRIHHVRSTKQRILSGDAWIGAAAALRSDYVVTTNNRDFKRIGVPAWNYAQNKQPPGRDKTSRSTKSIR